jgi:cytochrome c-type biogenesis protein CcmH/NrfF
MLAAAPVNWHYLLILLLPSVAACVMVALTWRSRAKRRRESDEKPRRAPDTKPRGPSSAKRRRK